MIRLIILTFVLTSSQSVNSLSPQVDATRSSQILTVAGLSMQPTLQPNDQVKLIRIPLNELQQDDLLAIKFKTRERLMLKRLIAKAGDKVVFDQGQVIINNKPLCNNKQTSLKPKQYKLLVLQLSRAGNRIPAGKVMVMGDSNNSFDSGDYGLVSHSQIVGKIEKAQGGATQ
jgi:signal peptidase I